MTTFVFEIVLRSTSDENVILSICLFVILGKQASTAKGACIKASVTTLFRFSSGSYVCKKKIETLGAVKELSSGNKIRWRSTFADSKNN